MSLLPGFDYWHPDIEILRSRRLHNQQFGMGLDLEDMMYNINLLRRPSWIYDRPWTTRAATSDTESTVMANKDKFQINLDVQQFKPEEITVKVIGNNVIQVECKHEERRDVHGMIYRHFVRKYVLPEGHDINQVASSLSSDGVLSIMAPRVGDVEQRTILVHTTGVPSKLAANNDDAKTTEIQTSEKATSEKATSEKATSKKATSEKATSEKATSEKATSEKATSEKKDSVV